jgi:WD40 repeat protein
VVGGGDEEYHDDADDDASETSSIATGAGSIHSPGRAVRMDISAINGSGAGNSPTKLPFLTSLSEGEGGAGKAEEGSETSSTSPKRMQLPTSLKSIQNKSLNSSAMRAANRRHSANTAHVSRDGSVPASSVFGPPVGKHGIIEYMSRREWIGHNDSINLLVPLHDHGCIVTVSLDGFHRVWNIDKDCLGEFPLPNLLEKMKNPRIRVVSLAQRQTG